MKILQIDLNIKKTDENANDFQNIIKNERDTSQIDPFKEINRKINTRDYDYVYFRNPAYLVEKDTILKTAEKLRENKIQNAEFTFREVDQVDLSVLTTFNYKGLLSSSLIEVKDRQDIIFGDTFYKTKFEKKPKIYIQAHYAEQPLLSESSKLHVDLEKLEPYEVIHAINVLIETNYIYELKSNGKINMSDNEILKNIHSLISSDEFVKDTGKDIQYQVLVKIEQLLNIVDLEENIENKLFFELVKKGYFDEALKEVAIFKSYSYWNNIEKDIENKYSVEFVDIRNSIAWKKTQKFRDFRISLKKKKYQIERHILEMIAKVNFRKDKEIWLISERTNTASDNSYFLYKYLKEKQKEVDVYYLIDKKAHKAIDKLEPLGRKSIIYLSTLKHKLMMIKADKLITSFTIEETMMPYNTKNYLEIYSDILERKDVVSIQHGMIINNVSPYLSKNSYWVDYITVNNKYEKDIIMNTLGFKDDEVFITGMARQDNLLKNSSMGNTVIFMPTWQRELQHLSPSQFVHSEYYLKIKELVNDKRMFNYLKNNRLVLKVLLHPQFNKYINLLNSNNPLIEFLSLESIDLPTLIAEAKFLITDFSSVSVDFLFQQKNTLFYQYNKYALHHVPTEDIRYIDIGKVVTNLNDLFEALDSFSANDFKLLPVYQSSYEKLFEIKSDIRSHIFQTIKSLEKKAHHHVKED
ncbi:CDP-glycerol glycerophosphotransferase family protein [Staphylococcus simulans]|uniref:CDP-glycerol glycerophosphotransferase family protein n=1 Tax=Staphylococcus simulans TaxID=1286 RepID=UPI0021CFFE9F|nr:CDP-glycerol glycerophosphotransferase family protein [Staphylococcus simulans]UXR45518.1 CDP-glycerol glycerophosphotransferase family protein [Staphylococcus simulans]